MTVLEKDLRDFLKRAFRENNWLNEHLFFVEAGKGGSDGNADVFWMRKGKIYPIELKVFKKGFYLRPSQWAFHRSCSEAECKSFVVAFVLDEKDTRKNRLMILDGGFIDAFRGYPQSLLLELENKNSDNVFWFMDGKDFEGQDDKMFRSCFYHLMLSFFDYKKT